MQDSLINALNGPILPKLALAMLVGALFLFLRRKDTEGEMLGYAVLAGLIALRDLAFGFLPGLPLANATDILLSCAFLFLSMRPFRLGWAFWLPLAAAAFALAALAVEGLGFSFGVPPEALRFSGLLPALALAFIPLALGDDADTNARQLSLRSALPLSLGLALYLAGGWLLGSDGSLFRSLAGPYLCCLLFVLALLYVSIIQSELVSAVDYYEESVDSLYDLLLATGASMRGEGLLQDVADSMLRAVVARTGADGGMLLLADEFEDSVSVRALFGEYPPPFKLPENLPKDRERVLDYLRHARFRLGEGMLGEIARTGKNVFVSASDREPALPSNGEESWLKLGSCIASPLILRDRIIGVVSVAKSGEGRFSERDFDRCKLLASFGSIAVANSFSFLEAAERSDIEREAEIAALMQKRLLPEELPKLPRLDFGAFSVSARGVSADYYDVIQTRPDKALLVVGDAAGKGVAAGTVLIMMRAILHLVSSTAKDVATLLQWVNRGVAGKVDSDHFATLCLASVDSGNGSAEIAIAGRQSAILCRGGSGALSAVEAKSVPLGIERGVSYSSSRVSLEPGDILVLFTDGLVETMNPQGRQYGLKGLGAALQAAAQGDDRGISAQEIAARIGADVELFAGKSPPHDDRTVLVMKRTQAG